MKRSFITAGLIFAALISCKKETPPSHDPGCCCVNGVTHLSGDVTNLKFKTNTYWVYIDSVSMAYDSVYIDQSGLSNIAVNQYCPGQLTEYYSFSTKGNLSTDQNLYTFLSAGIRRNATDAIETNSIIYSTGQPFSSTVASMVRKDSVFIYDRYYKNVEAYTVMQDKNENDMKTTYYINSDFGFLKKEVFNSNNTSFKRQLLVRKNVFKN